jgi:quercetin dioxygenase-like cupin family protein
VCLREEPCSSAPTRGTTRSPRATSRSTSSSCSRPARLGSTSPYARTRPYLEHSVYTRDGDDGRETLHVVRDEDVVWSRDLGVRCGTLAETPRLGAQLIEIDSGEASVLHAHEGDEVLYVLEGTVWVRAQRADETHVFELGEEDACLLPAGSEHEYRNYGGVTARTLVGVAPNE